MEDKWCNACGSKFSPRAQAPHQAYCAQPDCQRERKRVWQQAKRRSDPDYTVNQSKSQQTWVKSRPGYWQTYRAANPEYTDRNRRLQRGRNEQRRIAKMDASTSHLPLPSGMYRIQYLEGEAGSDPISWMLRIAVIGVTHEST